MSGICVVCGRAADFKCMTNEKSYCEQHYGETHRPDPATGKITHPLVSA